MRPALSFAFVVFGLVSAAGASDRTDEDCVDGTCVGRAYATSFEGKRLREPVPLPWQPGPHRCVIKPETKEIKQTVYETKLVPYCLPDPSCGDCCKDGCKTACPSCEKCVRWKKVVVKREITVGVRCCGKCVAEGCCSAAALAGRTVVPPAPPAARP